MSSTRGSGSNAPNADRRSARFVEELALTIGAGHGSEAMNLFCKGESLGLYPRDAGLEAWLRDSIGVDDMRQLITLFAISPCAFCRRGLEPCTDCDRHGHHDYEEICESCLGLGVCACDFCNGAGLASIDTVPAGLRVPVAIERAAAAFHQIEALLERLPVETRRVDPLDHLKNQASLILRLSGLLGSLENELGDARTLSWWTIHSPTEVSRIVSEWPRLGRRAEERMCAAFRSMSETASAMKRDRVAGSHAHSLASARAEYYGQFTTPESLERTDVDHPILDRVLAALGPGSAPIPRRTQTP